VDRVLVCCDDVFFRVNIEARIREARLRPVAASRLAEAEAQLAPPDAAGGGAAESRLRAAVVDLHALSGEALRIIERLAAAQPGLAILAFGPHVERELLKRARRAGAVALPRSRFVREYPEFMQKVGLGIPPAISESPSPTEEAPE
jgi:DNA-binding NarL/FixJ family response regulator